MPRLKNHTVERDRQNWVNSSPNFYRSDPNYLNDEQHGESRQEHAPLWLEIIDRNPNPASSAIVGLGTLVVSPLIELSQWGFPITYVSDVYERMCRVEKDLTVQAGEFEKLYYFNFLHACPRGKVVTFLGVLEHLGNDQIFEWIDLLLLRCKEIVCSVPVDRDWYGLLSSKYDTVVRRYPSGSYEVVVITNKHYEEQRNFKKSRREVEKRKQDSPTKSSTKIPIQSSSVRTKSTLRKKVSRSALPYAN